MWHVGFLTNAGLLDDYFCQGTITSEPSVTRTWPSHGYIKGKY
jgi:hypothetical protein